MNDPLDRNQGPLEKGGAITTADIAHGNDTGEIESTEALARNATAASGIKTVKDQQSAPLFSTGEAQEMRSRWDTTQSGFVDEPRKSVKEADSLVASAIKRLAEVFAEERSKLESQWDRGDNVSTEELRLALQRYRSFFTRLLSV
jgi:hypothetical protein